MKQKPSIVVVSPHPDDAVLSAYHVLGLAGDLDVVVLTIFCGVPPEPYCSLWDRLCGARSSAEQARRRILEDATVLPRFRGVSVGHPGLSRDWYDAGVREVVPGSATPTAEEIAEAIARETPAYLYVPLAGGPRPHPDHKLCRDAGRILAREGISTLAYADFPYCAKGGGWPDFVSRRGREARSPAWLRRAVRELPEIEALFTANEIELDDAAVAGKLAACRGYASQFDALDRKLREKGLVSNVDLLRYEFTWHVRSPR